MEFGYTFGFTDTRTVPGFQLKLQIYFQVALSGAPVQQINK